MEVHFHVFMNSAGLRVPTVCPHVWANESISFNHIDSKIVDFPGIFDTNRGAKRVRLEFEFLRGHPTSGYESHGVSKGTPQHSPWKMANCPVKPVPSSGFA